MSGWEYWPAFVELLSRWKHKGWVEFEGGGLQVCHTPSVAPRAYLHWLYPPLSEEAICAAEAHYDLAFPPSHRAFLASANGCRLFGRLALYGSLLRPDGLQLIDRSTTGLGQPISLDYGNLFGRPPGISNDAVVIGSMVGWDAKGKLVMARSGEIALVHPEDGRDVAEAWPNLVAMLFSEVERLAEMHDENGTFIAARVDALPAGARRWETANRI